MLVSLQQHDIQIDHGLTYVTFRVLVLISLSVTSFHYFDTKVNIPFNIPFVTMFGSEHASRGLMA